MPKVIVDVSNVPDSDYQSYDGPTPPKGLYKALWKRGWWTKTKDGKKTMLKVLFILETDNEAKKQFNGYPIFHNITYEPSTQWKMKELFAALRAGLKAAVDFDDKGDVSRIGRAQVQKTWLLIHAKDDYYNGQRRIVVDTLAPLPLKDGQEGMADEFMEEGDATAFEEAGGVPAEEATPSGDAQWSGSDVSSESSQDEPPF
jgi:hypothetical protein